MNKIKITVASAFGVEQMTKRELYRLGIEAKAINGRFTFDGDLEQLVKLNYNLRTADRVYIELARFNALTFDELFDNISLVNFEDYIPKDAKIFIKAKSVKSTLFAVTSITSISKKAIVNRLQEKLKTKFFDETGVQYTIEVAIHNDEVTVSLDTSGESLNKRGYRTLSYDAPLTETLAAAIIQLSVWNPDKTLIDPFCGSGTIPIEAAMQGLNIPSGYLRRFDYENFSFISNEIKARVIEEAKDNINWDRKLSILGYDINPDAISLCHYHAKKLGVANHVHFQTQKMQDLRSQAHYGVIITNPPYGERLMTKREVRKLYAEFGEMFITLKDFSCYLLTSYEEFARISRLKVTKERKLFNGGLAVRLYQVMGKKPTKVYKNNKNI